MKKLFFILLFTGVSLASFAQSNLTYRLCVVSNKWDIQVYQGAVMVNRHGSASANTFLSSNLDMSILLDNGRTINAKIANVQDCAGVAYGSYSAIQTFIATTEAGWALSSGGGSGGLTDSELRATPVAVSGSVMANTGLTQPLTDVQLRATPVAVSGSVTANTGLTQPLTDVQLRATPVAVSGTVTANTGLVQPLTDVQLRATPVNTEGKYNQGIADAGFLKITDDGEVNTAVVKNTRATIGDVGIVVNEKPVPFGTLAPVWSSYTTNGNVLVLTDVFEIYIQNKGNTAITINSGATVIAELPAYVAGNTPSQYYVKASIDPTTNKLVPLEAHTVNAAGSIALVRLVKIQP
jgi:hypothetical protein